MQRIEALRWNVVFFLLLGLSQLTYAQNLNSSSSYMSTTPQAGSPPTPTTMSNDAFKSKVASQNAQIQSSLQQETKNESASLTRSQPSMPLAMPPSDNSTRQSSPSINNPDTGTGMSSPYSIAPPSNEPSATNNAPPPSQGGWQIQY